jgi:hypothetical protein
MKRIVFFGYYLKQMNWKQLNLFLDYTSKLTKRNKLSLILAATRSVFVYNISILEYFQFRFFEKDKEERKKWAGTGFMYQTVLKLNPRKYTHILSNKSIFLEHYKDFVNHWYVNLDELEKNPSAIINKMSSDDNKVVVKNSKGQCGKGLQVINYSKNSDASILITQLKNTGNDIVEQYVEQHDELNRLSPSGLNTLRIFTIINNEGKVDILGARQRITVNSHIDNLAAGNMACDVDLATGKIIGPGVYSDITKTDSYKHPITGIELIGFQIPRFAEAIDLVTRASLFDTSNKTIGWDVAITNKGVELIEGNHNWCKLLWQLPVKTGMKSVLESYVK